MSLEEARIILGKDGEKISDEQLREIVRSLEYIAREAIKTAIDKEFKKL